MKKVKWGVIGCGGIADRRTLPGMMLAENAELIAVMDANKAAAENVKEKYGAKYAFDRYEDLLALEEIEAVCRNEEAKLGAKLAVERMPLINFFSAEEYHQKYLEKNPGGYCHIPKSMLNLNQK